MTRNVTKEQYIKRIRSESAYPAFRLLTNIFAIISYVIGGFTILSFTGVLTAKGLTLEGIVLSIATILVGIIFIIIGKVAKETSSMLADVADSIMDLNSRY